MEATVVDGTVSMSSMLVSESCISMSPSSKRSDEIDSESESESTSTSMMGTDDLNALQYSSVVGVEADLLDLELAVLVAEGLRCPDFENQTKERTTS